jgi:uncharacterized protein (DUF1778 family)
MSTSVQINMKASSEVRDLLDRAAKISHRNRTEFVLDAAVKMAENVILEQQLISLDEQAYTKFVEYLDAPPATNPRLKRLLGTKAPWE